MAEQRRGVVEDPNDPNYGQYIYGDSEADEYGNLPTDSAYQPPNLGYIQGPTQSAEQTITVGDTTYDLVDNSRTGGAVGYMPRAATSTTSTTGGTAPTGGGSQPQYSSVQQAVTPPSMQGWNGAPFSPVTRPNIQGPYTQPLQQAILDLLATPREVDPNALASSPENRAFRLAQQRAFERDRGALAEEASGQGWSDSGAFDSALGGLRQRRGEEEAMFLGNLATDKMTQYMRQLEFGISAAQSAGQFEAAQDMQAQLANLDAIMQRNRLAEQSREFDLGLGFDYTQLGVNANQAATNALLGG